MNMDRNNWHTKEIQYSGGRVEMGAYIGPVNHKISRRNGRVRLGR